jgi:hypothetical protein
MPSLRALQDRLLQDRRITPDEVAIIRSEIEADGRLDLDDVRFLVELLTGAQEVCPEFDELFFPVLHDVFVADGQIGPDEQFYLLKMLYSDGEVRDIERAFLKQLRSEVKNPSPEFATLCDEALACQSTGWGVGGR